MFSKALKVLNKAIVIMLVLGFTLVGVNFSFPRYLGTIAYAEGEDSTEHSADPSPTQSPEPSPSTPPQKKLSYLAQAKRDNKPVEITEKCDEYTTVFQNPDGTQSMYLFSEPVRYRDNEGKLVAIDNQIVDTSDDKKIEGYAFKNKSSYVDVYLPEDLISDVPVKLDFDKYSVEIKPINKIKISPEEKNNFIGELNEETVDIVKNEIDFSNEIQKINALANGTATEINSSIKYKSGQNDKVNIEYKPLSNGVKEDIILNQYTGQNKFDFDLNLTDLTAKQMDNGSIVLFDSETNEPVFTLPEMSMKDSFTGDRVEGDGHDSENVKYALKEGTGEGQYIVSVIADKEFLANKNTVYPVIIDPTMTAGIIDGYVRKDTPTTMYTGGTALKVGFPASSALCRSYIKFPQFPDFASLNGTIVQSAYLDLHESTNYTTSAYVTINRVSDQWDISSLYWNHQPGFDTTPEPNSEKLVDHQGEYQFDITRMVNNWYIYGSGDWDPKNKGLAIKLNNTQELDNSSARKYRCFRSSQDSASVAPYIIVNYSLTPAAPAVVNTIGTTDPNGKGYVTLNLTEMAGASLYHIYNGNTDLHVDSSTWQNVKVDLDPGQYTNIRYKASNQYGMDSQFSNNAATFTVPDGMTPDQSTINSVIVAPGDINSGKYNSIAVQFNNSVSDKPYRNDVNNQPVKASLYKLSMKQGANGTYRELSSLTPSGNTFTVTKTDGQTGADLPDNTTYYFKVSAYDSSGNHSDSNENYSLVYDRSGPAGTFSITPDPTKWTNNDPIIHWSNVTDPGNGTITLKYMVDSNSGDWSTAQTLGPVLAGQGTISGLSEGNHTLYVRAYDSSLNLHEYSFAYKRDTTAPTLAFDTPSPTSEIPTITGDVNGRYFVKASASDFNGMATWRLDFAPGTHPIATDFPSDSEPANIASGTGALESTSSKAWDLTGLMEDRNYTIRLRATDGAGNTSDIFAKVHYAKDTEDVAAHLSMVLKNGTQTIGLNDDISVGTVHTEYSVKPAFAPLPSMKGTLYANDVQKDVQTTSSVPLQFDPLAYDTVNNKWVYPEGSQAFLRVVTKEDDKNNYHFTNLTYEGHKITDDFSTSENISFSGTVRNGTKIELAQYNGVYNTDGTVRSILKTINGRISYVTFAADETKPSTNQNIHYYLVHDGVRTEINPNATSSLDIPVNNFYLEADLSTTDTTATPFIESWHLDVMYVAFGDSVVVNNSFVDNARGFIHLSNVVHDETNGSMRLSGMTYPEVIFPASGSFESTIRTTPGKVWEVFLAVDEVKPTNTDIAYYISTDGGIHWSTQRLIPGTDINQEGQWQLIKNLGSNMEDGTEIMLKAVLTGGGTVTPEVRSWVLRCRQTLTGEAHDIKLIDEPDNLSTLVDANYMTLLRWQPSETEGVTYNVYRSESEDVQLIPANLIQPNITGCSWSDFNLDFDQSKTFYYKVAAVKKYTVGGIEHDRISLPSNEAFAYNVSRNETDKKLGLQDYWTYSGFQTGGGTGYINVANGNMVYKSTDLTVPGPFFGAVMSRTYNEQARSKTPLGYGWDYSFNTCLLAIWNDAHTEITALVLKDGDGTLHTFPKVDGVFQSAKGTFMTIDESVPGEYQIKRKDDITYHFSKTTMKLNKFTNNNGKILLFKYDYDIDDGNDGIPDTTDRGNLKEIINDAGEKVSLDYFIDGAAPQDPDYVYINNNIDMLKTATWTSGTKSIVFTYHYNENDKLDYVTRTMEGNTVTIETFNYNVDLDSDQTTANQNVVFTDAEGRKTVVELDASKRVQKVYDPVDTLSGYASADNYAFTYDGAGTQMSVTNNRGVGTGYTYDANGLLSTKTDAMGHVTTYTHYPNYLVESVSYDNTYGDDTNPTTIRNYFTYNTAGNITQIRTEEKVGVDSYSPLGPQTDFTYNSTYTNKVETTTVKKDSTHSIVTRYTYTTNGNLETKTDAYGSVDADNRPIQKTTTYAYYPASDPDGIEWQLKSVTDQFGKETRYIYDGKGRIKLTEEYNADHNYVRTAAKYTYDDYGRTDTVSQPYNKNVINNPAVTDMNYDTNGMLQYKINPDNTAEKWEYDLTGRMMKHYTGVGNSLNENSANNVEGYIYDALGRLKSTTIYNDPTTDEDNITSSIDYSHWSSSDIPGDESDMIIKTDGEGRQIVEYYDILGRLYQTKQKKGTEYLLIATNFYDAIGNMKESRDSAGRISKAYYNKLNMQYKTVTDPFDPTDGKDNKNYETVIGYNYLGNTLTKTQVAYKSEADQANPVNYTISYQYDDLSRLESVTQANPNAGQQDEPDNLITTYHYDYEVTMDGKNLIKNYSVNPKGYISETYMDETGRKVIEYNKGDNTDGNDASGEYMKTTYTYDSDDGRFLTDTITRTDGTWEKYTYDVMGRVNQVNYYNQGSSTSSQHVQYDHNDLGQVKTEWMVDGATEHATSYIYDRMGRTDSVWEGTFHNDGTPNKVSDGLDVAYSYNKASQLTNINYDTSVTDGQHNLTYTYDIYGRTDEIQLDPIYEDPQIPADLNTVRKYVYDTGTGELDYIKDYRDFKEDNLTNYIKKDLTYNSAGQVEKLTYSDSVFGDVNNPDGITEQHTMKFDGRGYIAEEQIDTDYSATNPTSTIYKAYDYDSLGRLTKAGAGTVKKTDWVGWDKLNQYTYDDLGNRKTMDDGTNKIAYDYTQFNQLKTVSKYNTQTQAYDIFESYSYDLRGNQNVVYSDYANGAATKAEISTYDLLNQMTQVETTADAANLTNRTTINTNTYNANGQRMKKIEGNDTTRYFYSGDALLYTTDTMGALETENIPDLVGNIVASKRFDDDNNPNTPCEWENKYYFYNYDERGSTTAIVKPDGNTAEQYTYDEFGNITQTGTASFKNEITYTGSISDTSTGLQYMNARYYDSKNGRFISQDSYSGNAYEPWTQHLYSYCNNNPTNFIDPTGHLAAILDGKGGYLAEQKALKHNKKYNACITIADKKQLALDEAEANANASKGQQKVYLSYPYTKIKDSTGALAKILNGVDKTEFTTVDNYVWSCDYVEVKQISIHDDVPGLDPGENALRMDRWGAQTEYTLLGYMKGEKTAKEFIYYGQYDKTGKEYLQQEPWSAVNNGIDILYDPSSKVNLNPLGGGFTIH